MIPREKKRIRMHTDDLGRSFDSNDDFEIAWINPSNKDELQVLFEIHKSITGENLELYFDDLGRSFYQNK